MQALASVIEWMQHRPQEVTEAVRQVLLWSIGVGLITRDFRGEPWTDVQTVLTVSAVSGVLALIAGKATVAASKVRARERQAHAQGIEEGVRQSESGLGG